MNLDDEISQFEKTMERLVGAYRARMSELCKATDLTPSQFWAMASIGEAKRIKMSPLADCLALSMGAASTLVDRLVGRELVKRESDPQDRRAVYVSLTPKGQAVLEAAKGAKRNVAHHAFKQMAPETRQHFIAGLQALVDGWESLAATECTRSAAEN